jgi:hypothetical protein
MPVDFATLDASIKGGNNLEKICRELGLDQVQCQRLEGMVPQICGVTSKRTRAKSIRPRTRWQECIAVRRKGKPFDPQAIKELAKEYRAGKCP